ncbi:acyltransferase family protein [Cerasicoccus frondis]|uniref:acyltransferase family protein n=1 Tax=Cerasicoccus frondis TaxID=490090 RepID=UPI0028527F60|nr:acyltransferase family protein [Cerasicoccus frondis]
MSVEIKYRPEIDGLRSIAVLAVIVFHLNPAYIKGGFLGVDVFFVISGYLITSILLPQFAEKRFHFLEFWGRRFRRLYPALAVTVCGSLIAGAIILPNPERAAMPFQALAALFSYSNVYLWQSTGGYWTTASETIALLHTWSLSLEEQFYICFPFVLALVYWRFPKRVGVVLIALCVLSLAACIGLTEIKRSASFYLLPMRMWELLIGSLLACYQPRLRKPQSRLFVEALQVTAVVLILGSFLLIPNGKNFPGVWPLFQCAGTFLLLWLGSAGGVVPRVLSLAPVVYIGRISYSLYLWHWPVFVFGHYLDPSPNPILLLTLVFAASVLSYHFIEQPFRQKARMTRRVLVVGASGVAVSFAVLNAIPRSPLLSGLGDFESPVSLSRGMAYESGGVLPVTELEHLQSGGPIIAVVGSSHARVICPPIDAYAAASGSQFVSLSTSGVGITVDGPTAERADANTINENKINTLKLIKPSIVIVAGNWFVEFENEHSAEVLQERLRLLASAADRVIVLGQAPMAQLPDGYANALRKYLVSLALSGQELIVPLSPEVIAVNQWIEQIVHGLHNERIRYLDPHELLAIDGHQVKYIQDGRFLYSDFNHLNDSGAQVLFDGLLKEAIAGREE